jgi:hypothetical protein
VEETASSTASTAAVRVVAGHTKKTCLSSRSMHIVLRKQQDRQLHCLLTSRAYSGRYSTADEQSKEM